MFILRVEWAKIRRGQESFFLSTSYLFYRGIKTRTSKPGASIWLLNGKLYSFSLLLLNPIFGLGFCGG
jgi:hypothetical protein